MAKQTREWEKVRLLWSARLLMWGGGRGALLQARPPGPWHGPSLLRAAQDACDALCGEHVATLAANLTAAITFGGTNSVTEGILHPWGRGVANDEDDDPRGALPALEAGGGVASSRFLAGMQDGSLALWRATGSRDQTYTGHGWGNAIRCAAVLHPSRMVSGSTDSSLCVWRLQDGTQERQLLGHSDTVRAVLPLPDGRIVSAADDRTLRVWNLASGSCEAVLEGHKGGVWALLLVADGSNRRIVSGAWDSTLRVWTLAPGAEPVCTATLSGHTKEVLALAALGGSRVVSSSSDATMRLWDVDSGTCERAVDVGKGGVAHCLVAVGPATVLAGCGDGAVRAWHIDAASARCDRVMKGHSDGVFSMALLSDGCVVTGSSDKSISCWARYERERVLVPPVASGAVWSLSALGEPPSASVLASMWPMLEAPPAKGSSQVASGGSPRRPEARASESEKGDDAPSTGYFC